MPLDTDILLESEDVVYLSSPLATCTRITPNFRPRAHQKIISDAIVDAVNGDGPRWIAISIPQQFGKSFVTSIGTPLWWLELHALGIVPGGLVGIMSYEDGLAMDFSDKVRRTIAADQSKWFTRLRKDSRSKTYWQTEPGESGQGGGVYAVGMAGSVQGRPLSFLGIDDPTKNFDQAMSPTHQNAIWNNWTSVIYGRLQPWTVVVVTMVRWHPEDFIGRLESDDYEGDPADWKFIRIPYVAQEIRDDDDNPIPDPLGRSPGEPLLRPQADFTLKDAYAEAEQIERTVSTYSWNCLWNQDPREAEGCIFAESKWRYWGGDSDMPLPRNFDQMLTSLDCAFKDLKSSDWVVMGLWGRIDMDFFLIDLLRGKFSFTNTCIELKTFVTIARGRYPKATGILVEDKANGTAVIDQLRSRVGGLMEFDPGEYGSKLSRAHAVQPYQIGGNIYIPSESERLWVPRYRKELADFRGTANETDDQVDMTTQAILHMTKYTFEESVMEDCSDIDLSNLHATGR